MGFISVRTSTLRPDSDLLFDLYVHYQDTYLRYRANQQKFEKTSLERFKAKKVKKVFIDESQEPAYLSYLDQGLAELTKSDMNVESKAELVQDTLRQESDNIGKTLESEEAYRSSEARIHKVVDFMMGEPKALVNMLSAAGLSVDASAHGSTTSSLVLAVGTYSKQLDKEALTDLAVAALVHDTGLATLGFALTATIDSVPKDKRADFKKHPAVAVEQVAGKKFITPRVLRIIQDHEEFGEGLGFPEKKRIAKMQVDSRIFNMCDAFDHFSILAGKAPKECIGAFIEARSEHFDMKLLEILEKQVVAP